MSERRRQRCRCGQGPPADGAPQIALRHGERRYVVPVGRFGLLDALWEHRPQVVPPSDGQQSDLALDDLFAAGGPRRLSTLLAMLDGVRPPGATLEDVSRTGDDLEYLQCDEWPPWMDAALLECAAAGVLTGPMVQRAHERYGDRWILDGVTRGKIDPRFVRAITSAGAADDKVLTRLDHLAVLNAGDNPNVTTVAPFATTLTELDASGPRCGLLGRPLDAGLPALTWLNLSRCRGGPVLDAWLAAVAGGSPNLRHLDLSFSADVSRAGMAHVTSLPHLASVSLAYCVGLTDDIISPILSGTGPTLTSLNLAACGGLTTRGVAHIGRLTRLTSLDVSDFIDEATTAAALASIRDLTELTSLSVGGIRLTDACLAHLAAPFAHRLTSLSLSGSVGIGDAGLSHVACLTQLTALDLASSCRGATDAGLARLLGGGLPRLKSLSLARCSGITPLGLSNLAALTDLTSLNLTQCSCVTNAGLVQLSSCLPKLTSLTLAQCTRVGDAGLVQIGALTQLIHLDLSLCDVRDTGLTHIAHLGHLASLNLAWCSAITDVGVACLAGLVQLTSVNFSGCSDIGDTGLAALSGLIRLTSVNLSHCTGITDVGLVHLCCLTALTSLNLDECSRITDEGMQPLTALTRLSTLNLMYTQVTAKGVTRLSSCPKILLSGR